MRCSSCQREVSNLFSSCPYCNAPLATAMPTAGREASDQLERIRREARELRDSARAAILDDPPPTPVRGLPPALGVPDPRHRVASGGMPRPADLPIGSAARGRPAFRFERQAEAGATAGHRALEGLFEDVVQAVDFVALSDHIQSNEHYLARLASTRVVPAMDDHRVNAFAAEPTDENGDREDPVIVILGGEARVSRLVGWMLAGAFEAGDAAVLVEGSRRIGTAIRSGPMDDAAAARVFDALGLHGNDALALLARQFTQGCLASTLAHEVGHIALGHTMATERAQGDAGRNQEREADLFTASVLSTSLDPERAALCQLFSWLPLVWAEGGQADAGGRTHPPSVERLRSVFQNNSEAMEALARDHGITWDLVVRMLPEGLQREARA